MEIITRREANAKRLNWYFTGVPCKNGHVTRRHITAGCVGCCNASRTKAGKVFRKAILDKFGNHCGKCGYDKDERALQLDHVNGGEHRERKAIGKHAVWKRALADTEGLYQLLCANCNVIKKADNKE